MYHVTVVDDEPANLESLERILKSDGAEVHCFQDPREALHFLRNHRTSVLITDLRMNSMDGLELLETVKVLDASIEVVVMTAYGTVEVAVEAMKKGAYDFVTKPLQRVQVLKTVHRAIERRKLLNENLSLREELQQQQGSQYQTIVGKSEATRAVVEIASQAARSRANVLIEGESGTGKGVLAEFIHRSSDASSAMFVKINCTAIPENLLEAELFGFEAGAFTGASKRKKGRVELAHQGTLFLDEIGIAPITFQSKLLRFLQEGEFERLGSNETLHVDTRVISATNSDLKRAISEGQLREDLYYRLNVIHIRVPPLRERQDDIPLLVQKFLLDSAKKNSRPIFEISSEAMDALSRYRWPGNIRELQNVIERSVVLNRSGKIEVSDLPVEVAQNQASRNIIIPVGTSLREVEKLVMEETLKLTKGDRRLAANLLGVHPRTIYRNLEPLSTVEPAPEPTPEISSN
jgi:two-component system, NtrC family, response regulator HydG